jgi:hypothetical protein
MIWTTAATNIKGGVSKVEGKDPTLEDSYAEYGSYQYDYSSGGLVTAAQEDDVILEEEESPAGPTCVYTPWGAWEACSRACGSGVTQRARALTEGPEEACTHLTHVRSCFGRTCELDTQAVVKETATFLPGKFSSHRSGKVPQRML